jgi:hypothetical protein
MPAQKARWLGSNFRVIELGGGVNAVTRNALRLTNRQEKMDFMARFAGIGAKYARNVWMDIYDPTFREAVAIDARIQEISTALGYTFKTYEEHEAFYVTIAKDAGLERWELDRLLYRFTKQFLNNPHGI